MIAHAAYVATLNHDKYNEKANKALQMVIMRSQKPVQLTASGFLPLSMETFGIVRIKIAKFNQSIKKLPTFTYNF